MTYFRTWGLGPERQGGGWSGACCGKGVNEGLGVDGPRTAEPRQGPGKEEGGSRARWSETFGGGGCVQGAGKEAGGRHGGGRLMRVGSGCGDCGRSPRVGGKTFSPVGARPQKGRERELKSWRHVQQKERDGTHFFCNLTKIVNRSGEHS